MKTIGQARREKGIPESDYIKQSDTVERIGTIRALSRILGPPDHRFEYIDSCALLWSVEPVVGREVEVRVRADGSIYS